MCVVYLLFTFSNRPEAGEQLGGRLNQFPNWLKLGKGNGWDSVTVILVMYWYGEPRGVEYWNWQVVRTGQLVSRSFTWIRKVSGTLRYIIRRLVVRIIDDHSVVYFGHMWWMYLLGLVVSD